MPNTYFETCKDFVSKVDIEALSLFPLGNVLGRGMFFMFRQLGELKTADSTEYYGIKIPTLRKSMARDRFMSELAFINFTVGTSPDLAGYIPRFLALIAVEGEDDNNPSGILTEDVSKGGTKKVIAMRASDRVRELLYAPFSEFGPLDMVVSEDECDTSLAFDVQGEEKLLDFTPMPIHLSHLYASKAYRLARNEAIDLIPELTIIIPRNSILGAELNNITI